MAKYNISLQLRGFVPTATYSVQATTPKAAENLAHAQARAEYKAGLLTFELVEIITEAVEEYWLAGPSVNKHSLPLLIAPTEQPPISDRVGWSIKEWASACGLSAPYVQLLRRKGVIPSVKAGSRRLITISPEAYMALLVKQNQETAYSPRGRPIKNHPRRSSRQTSNGSSRGET